MTTDVISPDLKAALRRLKLSRMLDTLPERLTLARQQKMPHQDLLLLALSDEIARRDGRPAAQENRAARADALGDSLLILGYDRNVFRREVVRDGDSIINGPDENERGVLLQYFGEMIAPR